MQIDKWYPALACVALLVYVLLQRTSTTLDTSAKRMAVFTGVRRAWGETEESLKKRTLAQSRWPFKPEEPEVAWYARFVGRVLRRFGK